MRPTRSLALLAVSAVLLVLAGCTAGMGEEAPAARAGPVSGTGSDIAKGAGASDGSSRLLPARVPEPDQALLVRGSESVQGIAGFGRNAIPALYGEYALPSASGGIQLVSVWFTREALVLDVGWNPRSCAGLPAGFALAQSGPGMDGRSVLVASTTAYRIVIGLPPDFGSPCRFTAALIERFLFFMRNAAREEDLSFPAFLQL